MMFSSSSHQCSIIAAGLLTALALPYAQADLSISEFLASNSGASLVDQDGDSSDWIEIHNNGSAAVSLAGYSLTDDATDLDQWTFPNISIPANGYLVVFASQKNLTPTSGELHTNFKLSAGGEYLALVDPLNAVLDDFSPEYPAQEEDISYGLGTDGLTLGFFIAPTPGSSNSVSSAGRVGDTNFSVPRGIYDTPLSLEITSATVGSDIRYTTDGSTPSLTNGTTYSSPISINGTTVVRAAAFKSGLFPSNTDTSSYLFPSDIRNQNASGAAPAGWPSSSVNGQVYDYGMDPDITSRYTAQEMEDALTAIPSVMLTTDIENLTSSASGIYSNPGRHGIDWERPAHMEIIGNTIAAPVNVRCGLRIRGGASRSTSNPKHSFRLFFRNDYGDSSLQNPIFEAEGVDEFKKIDFRTAQNYSWSKDGNTGSNTFLRDVLGRDLQGASGQPYTRSRYYHLYLNGIYWGLFMTQERAEANWGASYLGGDDNDIDTLKSQGSSGGYRTEATDGDINGAWQDLWNLARAQESNPTTARYLQMQGLNSSGQRDPNLPVLLDVDNLIDYMIIIGYTGAFDNSLSNFVGASNNWYSVRNAVSNDQGFVHLLHDAEHSLGAGGGRWNNNNDRINTNDGSSSRNSFDRSNPQFLHLDLADSTPEYRLRFADRAHAALFNDGYLTKNRVLDTLEKRRQIVDQVIIAESARWGDAKRANPADKEDWEGAVQDLEDLFDTRGDIFLGHLRQGGLYPNTDAPVFSPSGGFIAASTAINVSSTEGMIYYTTDGSDPRQANGNPSGSAMSFSTGASTIIHQNSTWSFDDSGTDHGSSTLVAGASGYNSQNWKHPNFNDTAWSSGAAILGHGTLDNDANAVTTSMGDGTAPGGAKPITSYLRQEFNVANANAMTGLQGSLLADDGVIIYINGVEVHRSNMPSGAVSSTTTASSPVGGANELAYNPISLDPSSLVNGTNVIAVELHQTNANSSDLGFDLSLSAPVAQEVVLNAPTYLLARTLHNGEWSALTNQYYTTGEMPQPGDILISEIHYHPSDPTTTAELAASDDSSDFEFIELTNISDKHLEFRGLSLGQQVINDHLEGVTFTFEDGFLIEPGGRVSIVSNEAAFLARYPGLTTEEYGSAFQGKLGNSGEWLQVTNADGVALASFRYNDAAPWPTEADGDGESLQLTHLNQSADYTDPTHWIAITQNGSPSDIGPALFTGSENADLDGDGIPALIEYFSGSSDLINGSSPNNEFQQVPESGGTLFRYSFVRDPEALNIDWSFELSDDLLSWIAPPSAPTMVERVILPNGLLMETYEFDTSSEGSEFFLRQGVQISQ